MSPQKTPVNVFAIKKGSIVNVLSSNILESGKNGRPALLFALVVLMPLTISAGVRSHSRVLIKPTVTANERLRLVSKLAQITGWRKLAFDDKGELNPGDDGFVNGSSTARDLVDHAISGKNVIVIESANNRQDVVFCKIVPGVWNNGAETNPPAYVLMIDFSDFDRLVGDHTAAESFNIGWGVLHEFVHAVEDSVDSDEFGEVGACESTVNQMRRELGFAERREYFYTPVPGQSRSNFRTALVRLAFDEVLSESGKKKRHWLVWDAIAVGGLPKDLQVAALN